MGLAGSLRGKRVYFDTNIIIYLLEGFVAYRSVLDEIQMLLSTDACQAVTSELTICESLIKPFKVQSSADIMLYRSFLEESGVFDLIATSRSIYVQAAFIASATGMKTPDSIHIATALESKCDVILTNDKNLKTPASTKKVLLSDYQ